MSCNSDKATVIIVMNSETNELRAWDGHIGGSSRTSANGMLDIRKKRQGRSSKVCLQRVVNACSERY